MEKTTRVNAFTSVLNALQNGNATPDDIAFIEHVIEQEKNKSANRKSYKSKTQKENDPLKDAIVNFMEKGKAYTMTELMNTVPELKGYSSQKINGLLRTLRKEERIDRIEDKKGVKFAVK